MNLLYYEILILQDNKNLKESLWGPKYNKSKMATDEGLYVVKKRYFIPPKHDDPKKQFVRLVTCLDSYAES